MTNAYAGPVREEPLAIELHNTLYAAGGELADGLADARGARAWLEALASRLPQIGVPDGPLPQVAELVALRESVRAVLHDVVARQPPSASALEAINAASGRAPRSPEAELGSDGQARLGFSRHGASRADVVIGALAADAIELLTGPARASLRTCGSPGCVLLFLADPRRAWCSQACGNRARQARHYRRTHSQDA